MVTRIPGLKWSVSWNRKNNGSLISMAMIQNLQKLNSGMISHGFHQGKQHFFEQALGAAASLGQIKHWSPSMLPTRAHKGKLAQRQQQNQNNVSNVRQHISFLFLFVATQADGRILRENNDMVDFFLRTSVNPRPYQNRRLLNQL